MRRFVIAGVSLVAASPVCSRDLDCEALTSTRVPFSLSSTIRTTADGTVSLRKEEAHIYRKDGRLSVRYLAVGPVDGPLTRYAKGEASFGLVTATHRLSPAGDMTRASDLSYSPELTDDAFSARKDFSELKTVKTYAESGTEYHRVFRTDYRFLSKDFRQLGPCRLRVLKYGSASRSEDGSIATRMTVLSYSPELAMFLDAASSEAAPDDKVPVTDRVADGISLNFERFPGE